MVSYSSPRSLALRVTAAVAMEMAIITGTRRWAMRLSKA